VVAGRTYGAVTLRRRSPVIVSARGRGVNIVCGKGSDYDGDLLSNTVERNLYKTDPCLADTDLDGVQDGFEVQSALFLNDRALPYTGRKPYSNALDATDAGHDYDGDGLSSRMEYRAWAHAPASPAPSLLQPYTSAQDAPAFGGPYGDRPHFAPRSLDPSRMLYTDGTQRSPGAAGETAHPYLDFNGNGLTDDERDADGDGLRNVDEAHGFPDAIPAGVPTETDNLGMMRESYYSGTQVCSPDATWSFEYKPILPRSFLEPDYLDWDTDGDRVWDGNDDQDNDGVSNVDEVRPPWGVCGEGQATIGPFPFDGARNGATLLYDGTPMRRSPFNPCLPYRSDVCRIYEPR
jgi:hypothetical protein